MSRQRGLLFVCAVCLTLARPPCADEEIGAKALVAKALKAAGGEERLRQVKAVTFKARRTTSFPASKTRSDEVTTLGIPDLYRRDTATDRDGESVASRIAFNGGEGWVDNDGTVRVLEAAALSGERIQRDLDLISMLLVPLRDESATPPTLPRAMVGERPVSGLKFTHPTLGDVELYFDDETGLLVKAAFSRPGPIEIRYADHREATGIAGIRFPWRRTATGPGRPPVELVITEATLSGQAPDAGVFARPEGRPSDVPSPDPKRTRRLAMLCKIWGRARYLHPRLAAGEFDWDTPLIQALPKAAAAHDDDAFHEAVGAMLAALDDPATRVVRRRPGAEPQVERKQPRPPLIGWRDEDILVITPEDGNDGDIGRAYDELVRAVSRARGIVVDLRDVANLRFETLNGLLVTRDLMLPGARYAVHSGYATAMGQTSGGYTFKFETRPPESIRPAGEALGGGPRRVAFLVADTSLVPPIALALQLAGNGVIVAQGDLPPGAGVATTSVPPAAGAEVRLRVSDPTGPDKRTIRARADAKVEADADRGPDGPALRKAVELLRAPVSVRPDGDAGTPTAPPVWRSDRAYAAMLYPRLEYRRLALFRAWTIIDLFFPYKHLIGEDWDDVLTRFLPRFEAAADACEYALAVAEFWTSIHDSHGFVSSQELVQYFGTAAPAVGLRSIEGRPVVTAVLGGAMTGKLQVGDVVTHVDGEPVKARMDRLGRYLAASTPHSHDAIVMSRLLGGSEGSTCRMTVHGEGDDEIRAVEMLRSQANRRMVSLAEEPGPTVRVLPGNVGYVHMGRLTKDEVDGMFETLKDTRAIIFDQRNYPQGTAWSIAPRLNVRGARHGAAFRRNVVGGDPASLDGRETAVFSFLQPLPISSKPKYTGKVVMLIDERTMSQAEHTGLFFEAACGATFIGSPTVGANGDVTRFPVPGGIVLTFSGHDVRHADGRQLQRVGLVPDIEVRPTIAGIRAGRDEVLERALTHLGVSAAEAARPAKEDVPVPIAAAAADDGLKYADERFGFSLTVAKPWAEAALAGYVVPGVVRAAWSGPASASIVVFIQQPGEAISPRFLVDESAKAMREAFDCKIHTADVKTVSGKKAMWLVATGKGTGGTLTGQGDVDTTTHWVAIPREKDVVVVLLTCPAADYEARLPSFGSAIQTLKVEGTQTAEQSQAK